MSTYPTHRFFMHNTSLKFLVGYAYGVDSRNIRNDPAWMEAQQYDIDALVEGEKLLSYGQAKPLLRHLLEQRFGLTSHHETRSISGFALVNAKGTPLLRPSKEGVEPHAQILPDRIDAWHSTIKALASFLAGPVGAPVVDNTGISGTYDITLSYAPTNDPDSALPSIFAAVQEQLGLKLESQKVQVDQLLIDHVNRVPTEN